MATLAGCGGAATSAPPPPPTGEAPQLVVLLVADQLSYDLYDRYQRQFRFGLKTLRDGGTRYRATHDHGITETAPGHATLATGVHPARHGIPSNDWWGDERWVYAVEDDNTLQVGDSLVGRSPELLRRDGLGVWLQEAHPDARVVTVSAKDRSAVLMAGRANADAYWFEPLRGRFVTSTHFRSEYPGWVDRFHEAHRSTWLEERIWVDEVPPRLKRLSRADTSRFEGNGAQTFFPHRASEEASNVDESGAALDGIAREQAFFGWWATTPMLDRATFEFALAAVEAGGLGADETPDLLALSVSQTDRVGHAYGPNSREQFDNLLRLDAELGDFLSELDRLVGEGRWVVAFTSDHGIFPIPEYANATMGRVALPGCESPEHARHHV
ncbi:MAG: putative AlkP superfamily pyrophosphatase or phosphodiesterase [Myxococcota bacterium]|jgi:predicted AlkP superfamily pyrophosphatase or phosphodiesterase